MIKANLVVYTNTFLPYSETFVYDQIEILNQHFNVWVICEKKSEFVVFEFERLINLERPSSLIRKINSRLLYKGLSLYPLFNKRKLKSLIEELQPLAVVIHFAVNAIVFDSYFKKLGIRKIIFVHGFDASKLVKGSRLYAYFFRRMLENAENEIFFVSDGIKKIAEGLLKRKIGAKVFYLGTKVEFFKRTNYNVAASQFIQISSFTEKKGHSNLVKAVGLVVNKIKIHVTLVGEGPLLEDVKRQVEDLDLKEYFTFTGKRTHNEALDLLNKSKYFVHPSISACDSDSEGLPISILEAMSMEMPVVSTFHSGISEAVEDKVDGILIPENDIEGLANALSKIQCFDFLPSSRKKVYQRFDLKKNIIGLSRKIIDDSAI